MYSPRIDGELIPKLYCIAKAEHVPMTKLVNNLLKKATDNVKVAKKIRTEETAMPKETYVIQGGENESKRNKKDKSDYRAPL